MPSIPVYLPSTQSEDNTEAANSLPQLLQTPSGLALLEIQGTINIPPPNLLENKENSPEGATAVGRIEFPDYIKDDPSGGTTWMKRVHLYIGPHQRMTGEVKRLEKPMALLRKRESTETEELEIAEVVRYKMLFSSRPEPVSESIENQRD